MAEAAEAARGAAGKAEFDEAAKTAEALKTPKPPAVCSGRMHPFRKWLSCFITTQNQQKEQAKQERRRRRRRSSSQSPFFRRQQKERRSSMSPAAKLYIEESTYSLRDEKDNLQQQKRKDMGNIEDQNLKKVTFDLTTTKEYECVNYCITDDGGGSGVEENEVERTASAENCQWYSAADYKRFRDEATQHGYDVRLFVSSSVKNGMRSASGCRGISNNDSCVQVMLNVYHKCCIAAALFDKQQEDDPNLPPPRVLSRLELFQLTHVYYEYSSCWGLERFISETLSKARQAKRTEALESVFQLQMQHENETRKHKKRCRASQNNIEKRMGLIEEEEGDCDCNTFCVEHEDSSSSTPCSSRCCCKGESNLNEDFAESLRLATEQVTRPSRLFARMIGQAQALSLYHMEQQVTVKKEQTEQQEQPKRRTNKTKTNQEYEESEEFQFAPKQRE